MARTSEASSSTGAAGYLSVTPRPCYALARSINNAAEERDMPKVAPARALVIEANEEYRAVISCCAGLADIAVETVATVSAGVRQLGDSEFDLVIWGVPPGDPRRAPVIGQIGEESTAPLRGPGPTSVVPLATRIELAGTVLDSEARTITQGDRVVTFSRCDWELLTFLLANPGQWFSAEDLVRHAWRSSRFSAEQLRS